MSYTVEDYIDPRFDIVDATGVVWHLNAGSTVDKSDGGTVTVDSASEIRVQLPLRLISRLRNPICASTATRICTASWVGSGCPLQRCRREQAAVRNAQITIRAKEDFLGGNAILVDGNEAGMNWVYHPDDVGDIFKGNSGTDTDLPCRDFPCTAVNVTPVKEERDVTQIISMGDELYARGIAVDIIRTTAEQATGIERYYWEYSTTGGRFISLSIFLYAVQNRVQGQFLFWVKRVIEAITEQIYHCFWASLPIIRATLDTIIYRICCPSV